jgi:anaerobic magnesium-protoporphyrin IX monomethyl ester cyclase
VLKLEGVEVTLFDTSLYTKQYGMVDSDRVLEENLTVKPFSENLAKHKISYRDSDYHDDFVKTVNAFQPDLIAASATESTFEGTIRLLRKAHSFKIPTILGGVFATFAPEVAIRYPEIDMICVGEGERALAELVRKMRCGDDYSTIRNLWVKQSDGTLIKNPLSPPIDLDSNPLPDLEIFEDSRFYRAMSGSIYKMFPVETHRGCVGECGFCNSPLQNRMYREETSTSYFRKKSTERVFDEITYCQRLGAEYLFFWADNFFLYNEREIDEFCERYASVKLPFWCQTHPGTISRRKVQKLKEVGLDRVGIGIEHGNEEFRRRVIRRSYSNRTLIDNLSIFSEYAIEFNVNNIIGFPDETPELAMDTVELNRLHRANDISCSIFTPFRGTPLRQLAVERGYLKNPDVFAPSDADASILDMPQFTPTEILGKRRTFIMYIKFPKNRWDEIRQAEKTTPEGDRIWKNLRDEYLSTIAA